MAATKLTVFGLDGYLRARGLILETQDFGEQVILREAESLIAARTGATTAYFGARPKPRGNCPNCGAPHTPSPACDYCGSHRG